MCVYVCVSSGSVVSNSLQTHELQLARFFCPWDFTGKNTRVDCYALLQGIFPTQGIKPMSLVSPAFEGRFFTTSATWETHSDSVFYSL